MSNTSFRFQVITNQPNPEVKFHCWRHDSSWGGSTVSWGDGSSPTFTTATHNGQRGNPQTLLTHTYTGQGTYTIEIEPGNKGFRFDVTSSDVSIKIGDILQWGSNEWASVDPTPCLSVGCINDFFSDFRFYNQQELDVKAPDRIYFRGIDSSGNEFSQKAWDLGQVQTSDWYSPGIRPTLINISEAFKGCSNLVGTYSLNYISGPMMYQWYNFIDNTNVKFRSPIDNWKFTMFMRSEQYGLPTLPIPSPGVTSSISGDIWGQNTEYFRAGLNISKWFLVEAFPSGRQYFQFFNSSGNATQGTGNFKFNTFAQPRWVTPVNVNSRSDQSVQPNIMWVDINNPPYPPSMPQWRTLSGNLPINQVTSATAYSFVDCPSPSVWCNEPFYFIIDTFYAGPTVSGNSLDVRRQNFQENNAFSIHMGHEFYLVNHSLYNNPGSTFSGYQINTGFITTATSSFSYGKYFINPNLLKDHVERRVVSVWGPTSGIFAIYAQGPTNSIRDRFGLTQSDQFHLQRMELNSSDYDLLRRRAADTNFDGVLNTGDVFGLTSFGLRNISFPGTDGQYVLYPATFSIPELPLVTVSPYDNRQRPYLKVGIRGLGSVTPDIDRVNICGGSSYFWSRNGTNYNSATQAYHTDGTWSTWMLDLQITTPPSVTISGSNSVCSGSTITLTGAPTPGTWTISDPSIATINANNSGQVIVTGASQGFAYITYTVLGTDGCQGNIYTQSHLITVTNPPNAGVITGSRSLCVGQNSTFTSDGQSGGSWSSSNTSVAIINQSSGSLTGLTGGTSIISYTVQGTGGCPNVSSTMSVTITNPPNAGVITGTHSLCFGQTSSFTSTGTTGGSWSSSNTQVATVDANTGLVTADNQAGTATITYTVTGQGGCPDATATLVVTVTAPPQAGTLSGVQNICVGSTTTFTSTEQGGSWVSSNTSVATVNPTTGLVTGVVAGTATITYTVTGQGGCPDATATLVVTVTAPPQAGTLSGVQNICVGSDTTFTSTEQGGSWESNNPPVATVNPTTGLVTGVLAGTATITYTILGTGGCPNATATRQVTVSEQISSTFSYSTLFLCQGSTTSFVPQDNVGTWNSSSISVATVSQTGIVGGEGSGTSIITYTIPSIGGCPATSSSVEVTVTSPVTGLNITGPSDICLNTQTLFTASGSGGNWSIQPSTNATINSDGYVIGTTPGGVTISYTIPSSGGCPQITASMSVTINTPPDSGNITGSSSLCVGDSTQLSSDGDTGGFWTSSNITIATVDGNGTSCDVTGASGGFVDITYIIPSQGGCPTVSSFHHMTITNGPIPGIITPSSYTFNCYGETHSFSITPRDSRGSWVSGSSSIVTINSDGLATAGVSGTTVISFDIPSQGGCLSLSHTVSVTVNSPVSAGSISGPNEYCHPGGTGQLSLSNDANMGGVWSSSDIDVVTVSNSGLVTTVSTGGATISYTVSSSGSCPPSTASYHVTVTSVSSPGQINGQNQICIPGTRQLTLSGSPSTNGYWTSSNPILAEVDAQGLVTGSQAGGVTISYIVPASGGCSPTSSSIQLTMTSPLPDVVITGSQSICSGSGVSFLATPVGGYWDSSNNIVATVSTQGFVEGISQGNAIITYTVTGTGGCPDKVGTFSVTIFTPPSSVISSPQQDLDICIGSTFNFTSTSSGGTWDSSNPTVASIDQGGGLTGLSAGISTITYTVSGGGVCPDSSSTRGVRVFSQPTSEITNRYDNICVGSSYNFQAQGSGPGTWRSSDTQIASVNNQGTVTGHGQGGATISFTVTGQAGCPSATDEVFVNVISPPQQATITGSNYICWGYTSSFTASPTGGVWSISPGNIAQIDSTTGVVTPLIPGTSTIYYTIPGSGSCPNSVSQFNIEVTQPLDPGTLNGAAQLCQNSTFQFSSTISGGSWTSSNPTVADVTTTGLVTGLTGGNSHIIYEVTSSYGCPSVTSSIPVEVTLAPQYGVISPMTHTFNCSGQTQSFTITPQDPRGHWDSDTPSVATIDRSTGIAQAVSTGVCELLFKIPQQGGCAELIIQTGQIIVNSPLSSGTITGPVYYCHPGGTGSLTTNGNPGGVWNISNILVATISSLGVVTAQGQGQATASYTVQSGGNCPSSTSYFGITVSTQLSAGSISGDQDIYVGDQTTFTSTSGDPGEWSSNNPSVASVVIHSGQVTGNQAGTATISFTVLGTGGCVTSTASLTVTVHDRPSSGMINGVDELCVGQTATYTSSPSGGVWSSSDTGVATVDSSSGEVTAVSAGTSTITYTITGQYNNTITSSSTKVVTVYSTPVSGTLLGEQNICEGLTSQFSSTHQGGIWTSSDNTIATVTSNANGGLVEGISQGGATISYTVQGQGGCPDAVSTRNVIVTSPSVVTLSGQHSTCVGLTVSIIPSPSGGVWSVLTPNLATIDLQGIVRAIQVGIIQIRYTLAGSGGCPPVETDWYINVYPSPNAGTMNGVQNICVNNQVTYTTGGDTGGTWTSSNPSVADVDQSGVVTGVSGGSSLILYEVGSTNCPGLTDSTSLTITVTPGPISGALSPQNFTFSCTGITQQFTISPQDPTGVWSSSEDSIVSIDPVSGLATSNLPGNSIISFTIPPLGGCLGVTISTNVSVETPLNAGVISGSNVLCSPGETTQLNSNGVQGGVWISSYPNIAQVDINTGEVTAISVGTTIISYIVARGNNNCPDAIATHTIEVLAAPSAGTIIGSSNLCVGSSFQYSSTSPNTGGEWLVDNTSLAQVNQFGTLTANSPGQIILTYTVNSQNTTCPSVSTTLTITITSPPPSQITISGSQSMCTGVTTQFTASPSDPFGRWSSTNPSSVSVNPFNGQVAALSGGSAIITYTIPGVGGCSDSTGQITVTVTSRPNTGIIVGSTTICSGGYTQSYTAQGGDSTGTWSIFGGSALIESSQGNTCVVKSQSIFTSSQVVELRYRILAQGSCPERRSVFRITIYKKPTPNITALNSIRNPLAIGASIGTPMVVPTFWNIEAATGLGYSIINIGNLAGIRYITINVSGTLTNLGDGRIFRIMPEDYPQTPSSVNRIWSTSAWVSLSELSNNYQLPELVTKLQEFDINSTNNHGFLGETYSYNSVGTVIEKIRNVFTLTETNTTHIRSVWDFHVNSTGSYNFNINFGYPQLEENGLCIGSEIQSQTIGEYITGTWDSSDPSIALVDQYGIIRGISEGTASISFQVDGRGGCSDGLDSLQVRVFAPPTSGTLTSDSGSDICVGESSQFSSDVSGGFWSCSPTSLANITTGGSLTGLFPGNVVVSYTVPGQADCPSSVSTYQITIHPPNTLPTIQGVIPGARICLGSRIVLTGTPSGGTWSSSDTNLATIDTYSGVLNTLRPGTVTISYSVSDLNNVCSPRTITRNIVIISLPTLEFYRTRTSEITSSFTMCINSTETISIYDISSQIQPYRSTSLGVFSLVQNSGAISLSPNGVVTSGGSPGQETIRYTLLGSRIGFMCQDINIDLIVTVVGPLPQATISGSQSFCIYSPSTFTYTCTEPGNWSIDDPLNRSQIITNPTSTSSVDISFLPGSPQSSRTVIINHDRSNECGNTRTTFSVTVTTGRVFTTSAGPIPAGGSFVWTRDTDGTLIQTITQPGSYTHIDSDCTRFDLIITFLPGCICWQIENISTELVGYYRLFDIGCQFMRSWNPNITNYNPLNHPYPVWSSQGLAILPGEIINFCAPTFSIDPNSEGIIITNNTDTNSKCVVPSPTSWAPTTNLDDTCHPPECGCNCVSMTYSQTGYMDVDPPKALFKPDFCYSGDCPESVRQNTHHAYGLNQTLFGWQFQFVSPYLLQNINYYPGIPSRVVGNYLKICGSPVGKPFYLNSYAPDPNSQLGGNLFFYKGNTYSTFNLPGGFTWSISDTQCCGEAFLPQRMHAFQTPYERLSWEGTWSGTGRVYPYYPVLHPYQTITHYQNNNCPPPSPPEEPQLPTE